MRWASVVAEATDLEAAIADASARARAALDGGAADLAMLFVSHHFAPHYDEAGAMLRERLAAGVVVGCSAGGIIGGGREIEHASGVALTVAELPGVALQPFTLRTEDLPDADAAPRAWHAAIGVDPTPVPHFLLLADPFTFPVEALLAGLDYAFPRSTTIGGLASGARQSGGNALYAGEWVHRSGLVGVALSGNVHVEAVVAQGCRPIGTPMQVTRCEGHVLQELDGTPPLHVLQALVPQLSDAERRLLSRAIFLGIVVDELAAEHRRGDFLVRNVVAIRPREGALVVGELLHPGQTVQFHVRDARTSAEDLTMLLRRAAAGGPFGTEAGALLFSCLGRGESLYGRPDHDTELFREHLGDVPLGGFFCNGEIGPVGGSTRVHGYTSAFGLFRPAT